MSQPLSDYLASTVITRFSEEKLVNLGQSTYKVTLYCDDVLDLEGSDPISQTLHIGKFPEDQPPRLRSIVRKTETFGSWVRCRTIVVTAVNLTSGMMPTTQQLWEIMLGLTGEFSLQALQILVEFRLDLEKDLQIYPIIATHGFGEGQEPENPLTPENSQTATFTVSQ